MTGVNVSNAAAAFRASVERVRDRDMNRAIAIALNRTADGVRVEATRRIRLVYAVKKQELSRAFTIRRAYAGNLRTIVFANGRPLNVAAFGARQTRQGVSVAIKTGARRLIPGAFFMKIKSTGYYGVFERKFVSGRAGKRWGRYPVRAVRTVDVPGLFRKEIVKEGLAAVVPERFRRELTRAVRAITLMGK
jgi:hypothetical protein